MKIIFYIFFFSQFVSYSQNKVETLVNKLVSDILPESFNFIYLVEESLNEKTAFDSLSVESPYYFISRYNPDLPKDLLNKVENKTVKWSEFNLDKVKYINQEIANKVKFNKYDVYFTNKRTSNDSILSLNKNKEIKTLIVKKSKRWSEKKIWDEIEKEWNKYKIHEKEQKFCYNLSNPIFSKDEKYARISVFEYKACEGNCFTYIYKYENGNWKLLAEFNQNSIRVIKTHVNCEESLDVNIMN